jgi:hypothetical protein
VARYGRRVARHAAVLVDPLFASDDARRQTEIWTRALDTLGFSTQVVDVAPMSAAEVAQAIEGCALALVENVCSVPANPASAHAVVNALAAFAETGGRVLFHHHDLPWQPGWADQPDLGLPPRLRGATHIGVSLRAQRDLHARGYSPVVALHDHFDFDAPVGDRIRTRTALDFGDDEIVLYQPAGATRTTNVAGSIRFVRALAGVIKNRPLRYWLRGPIDDDVAATVAQLLEHCPAPVTIDADVDERDALAACDVVLHPSTWDASGATVVKSVIARRPCVVGPFPVLGELRAIGLRGFELDEPLELVKFLAKPSDVLFDVNARRARLSFDAAELPGKIGEVLTLTGVTV